MRAGHAVVFAGGDPSRPDDLIGVGRDGLVIAADSGAVHAEALGWRVDLLVGDLDSVPPELARRLAAQGTVVQRHPAAKDQTDLALALDVALEAGVAGLTVVGGHGGRLDHLLANVLLLGAERYAELEIDARMGAARVTIVRGRRRLAGVAGDVVSLLALGGQATGVTTVGLLFPLRDATLTPGTSWGVSNEMVGAQAEIDVGGGVVAAVQPAVRGALLDRAELDPS